MISFGIEGSQMLCSISSSFNSTIILAYLD